MNAGLLPSACAIVGAFCFSILLTTAQAAEPRYVNQGQDWNQTTRNSFYSQDQGSRMMPLAWFQALQRPDGTPFAGDKLQRYGYLPNSASPSGLPVGFTTGNWQGKAYVGMSCAACHTREISVAGVSYRIDGGPAIVDFQSFLHDLDDAMDKTLNDDARFAAFAARVGTPAPSLRPDVQQWYMPFHTLMDKALPKSSPWGPGRLDAVGMIFDRLTGLDIGKTPDHIIANNIQQADAPVRYPFLWNAAKQDLTQWPGFSPNGSDLFGLGRNLGEVFGVFAVFYPSRPLLLVDYRTTNSANFDGLKKLETLIHRIGRPRWPFGFGPDHDALVKRGGEIFNRSVAQGGAGCADCHGAVTPFGRKTWKTPLVDVGTDSREYQVLGWKTQETGVLEGSLVPFTLNFLGREEKSIDVLKTSVIGAMLQHREAFVIGGKNLLDTEGALLAQLFKVRPDSGIVYEARVLEGIWAAAPYLHNGSVPTLADLLTPPAERPPSFKIGPAYDPDKVGLAQTQTMFEQTLTTGCGPSDRNSGNSNCGHDFGTWLMPDEKKALLEYLKQL